MKVDIEIVEVKACKVPFKCSYCHAEIGVGKPYTKVTSRLKDERFPQTIKVCATHPAAVIPLGLLIQR